MSHYYVASFVIAIALLPAAVFHLWNGGARWLRRRRAAALPLAAILLLGCNSGNADADNSETISVLCSTSAMYGGVPVMLAVKSFPGMSADDILASVWVVEPPPDGATDAEANGTDYKPMTLTPLTSFVVRIANGSSVDGALVADGSAAIVCAGELTAVTLFVRCEKEVCP